MSASLFFAVGCMQRSRGERFPLGKCELLLLFFFIDNFSSYILFCISVWSWFERFFTHSPIIQGFRTCEHGDAIGNNAAWLPDWMLIAQHAITQNQNQSWIAGDENSNIGRTRFSNRTYMDDKCAMAKHHHIRTYRWLDTHCLCAGKMCDTCQSVLDSLLRRRWEYFHYIKKMPKHFWFCVGVRVY